MDIKNKIGLSFLFIVYLFAASLLSMVISLLPLYIARFLSADGFIRNIVHLISICLISLIILYVLMFRSGYQYNNAKTKFSFYHLSAMLAFSMLIYYITGVVSGYFIPLYSSVYLLASFIVNDMEIGIRELQQKHSGVMNISFFISSLPFLIPMLLGFYGGFKKRETERQKTLNTG